MLNRLCKFEAHDDTLIDSRTCQGASLLFDH
jgi:hypothetical protein